KEGITHNTVVGNVEIGTSSGDEINRDIDKMQETTKDKDSGHYNIFVEKDVLVLATEKGREDFKASLELAGEEAAAIVRVADTVINKQNDDKRNPLTVLGEERQAEKWRNEGLVEDFKNAESQEEMAEAIERMGAKEGYEVEVIYSDSSNYENLEGRGGQAYIDSNGKIVIIVNTEAEGIENKDVLAGVLAEELSHGINYADGKDKGAGTETLAGHSNDYFAGKLGDSNASLTLTGDGKDYNGVDFGINVGSRNQLITEKSSVQDIEKKVNLYITGGTFVAPHAAKNLKHYMDGNGKDLYLDSMWYFSYSFTKEFHDNNNAVYESQKYVFDSVINKYGSLIAMPEGASFVIKDKQSLTIPDSIFRNNKGEIKFGLHDLFYSIGQHQLNVENSYTITKKNGKIETNGKINYYLGYGNDKYENYDWHPEQGFAVNILGDTVTNGALKKLIDSKNAKEFKVYMNEVKEIRRSYNIPKSR
ncbi:MAG: hypothetical protein LBV03_00075, partial [Fusobacteriales bacterium]|nr:hypothetical protein [Fusobacteriales bacterium]